MYKENLTNDEILAMADEFIDATWEEIVDEIGKLVAVPSVVNWDAATADDPSGPDAHNALRASVDLARRLGFSAFDDKGEIGIADLPGQTDTHLAMICHADVVTPGVGWTVDPWTMIRRDGFLIGRGVIDDKGPLVVALYAMKFFADHAWPLPYTLRMLIGTNEETGVMRDVRYYLREYPAPAFIFTPDATFPCGYGEKGQYAGSIVSKVIEGGQIADFTTGDSSTNAVPSQATMVVRADATLLPAAPGIEIAACGDGLAKLVATGRGGHASLPEGTVNAINMLVKYALANGLGNADERAYLQVIGNLMDATDGSTVGLDTADADFGPLTIICGTIHLTGGQFATTVDSRWPTSTSERQITEKLCAAAAPAGATAFARIVQKPFLMDPKSPIIQTLAQSYREATGLDGEPFTMGGGTYAREFPFAASFGVEDPHDAYPAWVGPMHGADEGVAEETLRRALRTYILTLARLMELDLAALNK